MDWSVVYLIFMLGLVVEAGREAFHPNIKQWAARHYSRTQVTKELPWWAERRSWLERREHKRKWHIDLLARMKPRRRV